MPAWLSDRARPWVGAICLAWLLTIAAIYGHYSTTKPVGFRYCLQHLEECRDSTILLPLWRVTALHERGYELYKITGPIPVDGDPQGLQVGDTVSLVTRFDADRQVVVEVRRDVHHLRTAKVGLGMLGVLLSFLVIVRGFRWAGGGVVPRG